MTAREELVEVMARAIEDDGRMAFTGEWPWPEPLAVALDALAAARVSVPCPNLDCREGWVVHDDGSRDHCPVLDCSWGLVPIGSLLRDLRAGETP